MATHRYKDNKYKYMVIITWSEEDQGYGVEVPELPGCFSFGKTLQKAVQNSTNAIESWIEAAKEGHVEIPEPVTTKKFSGKFNLRINPDLHRDLAIKAKKQGQSLNVYVNELLQHAS